MEKSPDNEPKDSDKKSDKTESSKSKQKKAASIGWFAVTPKSEAQKNDKPEKAETLSEWLDKTKAADAETVTEAKAPIDSLSSEEITLIVPLLAEAAKTEAFEQAESSEQDLISTEAEAAVIKFHEKLMSGDDLDAAEAAVLDDLSADESLYTPQVDEPPQEFGEAAVVLAEFNEPQKPQEQQVQQVQPEQPEPQKPVPTTVRAATPNITPVTLPRSAEQIDKASPAAAALAGGIVGYLVGRRRGRIKTEKKLLPVQRKLKKEVSSLQVQLQQKENNIRFVATKVARTKYNNQPSPPAIGERVNTVPQSPIIETSVRTIMQSPAFESRRSAPEAADLHNKQRAPEHIGHMLVVAEAAERKPAPAEPMRSVEKHVDTMNRMELMNLSSKIKVEGTTLRQIYETSLISEKGLRRLVREHLRGGNVQKMLRREITERDLDFERDPALRDRGTTVNPVAKAGRATTLAEFLEKADASLGKDSDELAFFKARAAFEKQQTAKQNSHRKIMDVSMVGTILILAVLVAVLVITHQ